MVSYNKQGGIVVLYIKQAIKVMGQKQTSSSKCPEAFKFNKYNVAITNFLEISKI